MEIVKFDHHGAQVSSRKKLAGKHRDYCLCHICNKLDIENRDNNCKIASRLFKLDQECEITTPVFYCAEFEDK